MGEGRMGMYMGGGRVGMYMEGGRVGGLTGRLRKCCSPKEYHKNVFEYLEFVMKSKYMDGVG